MNTKRVSIDLAKNVFSNLHLEQDRKDTFEQKG